MHDEIEGPQDATAGAQKHEVQEARLRTAKITDYRDFDCWATDEQVCQRFLVDRPPSWRIAVQRYWRDRITRRQLAAELGQSLETAKNLLRAIRKAAKDLQSGKPRKYRDFQAQWPRRPHSTINRHDILAMCDGDPDAIAHAEEYGRLAILDKLSLFAPAISGELVKVFEHSSAIGSAIANTRRAEIASRLIERADGLKAQSAKDDAFIGRPLFQGFTDARTQYHADRRGRPRKEQPITPARKRGRPSKPIRPDISGRITPIPPSIFLDQRIPQHLGESMQYQEAAEIIKHHDIPRSTVARLSGLYLSDLSGWLNGRTDLAQDKIERVSVVVADIAKMIEAMKTLSIGVDLTDCQNVRLLVQKINDAEMQMDMALDGPDLNSIEPGMEAAN